MSIGLARGTVALEPHNAYWELSAKNLIEKIKDFRECLKRVNSISIYNEFLNSVSG